MVGSPRSSNRRNGWFCGSYLAGHLPNAVDELDEDGRAVGVRVVLVPVADPLDRKQEVG